MKELYMHEEEVAKRILDKFYRGLPYSVACDIKGKFFLAGGAIGSLLTSEKVNDYDIYFTEFEALDAYMKYVMKEYNDFKWNPKFVYRRDDSNDGRINTETEYSGTEDFQGVNNWANNDECKSLFASENALSFSNGFQVIFRFVGDPETITNNFDFDHCCAYILHDSEEGLVVPNHTVKSLMSKQLRVRGTKYPIDSLHRSKKYMARGYDLDIVETMKIVMAINALDLRNPSVFRDQMLGIDASYLKSFVNEIDGVSNTFNGVNVLELLRVAFNDHLKEKIDTKFKG